MKVAHIYWVRQILGRLCEFQLSKSCALTKGPTKTVGPTLRPPISSSCSRVVLCPLRSSVGLFVSILKLLGAGHHAANVVDAASMVGSDGVGVSMVVGIGGVGDGSHGSGGLSSLHLNLGSNSAGSQVGVGSVGVWVGGVGDGGGGDGHGGNDGLLVNVGNGNVAGGVMNVGLSSGGGVVSNITSGIMNVGKSSRGVVNSDITSGIMDVGESGGGLVAIRDGAGESQGNGGQEN